MKEDDASSIDIQVIGQTLTDNTCSDDNKFLAIQSLKTVFNISSKTYNNLELESLLDNIIPFQSLKKCDKNFLFSYGVSLINFIERNASLKPKMYLQLESVLNELKKQDDGLTDMLISKLWHSPEYLSDPNLNFVQKILSQSGKLLEEVVLNWVEESSVICEANCLVKLSTDWPELFQTVTAIIYQFIVKSEGNLKFFEIMNSFVTSVMSICEREQKDFLSLYPRDCCQLVSFLIIPPEIYPKENRNDTLITRSLVSGLLSDYFFENSKRCLMLLSHYPGWLTVLKMHLNENQI